MEMPKIQFFSTIDALPGLSRVSKNLENVLEYEVDNLKQILFNKT